MRFTIVATVAALSSTVLAQGLLSQIPKCAQTCFGNNLGTCGPVDIACVCGNKSVINSVSCCVFATCSQADITTTINFAVNLCKAANIDVNTNPTCPSNSASSALASASASASGASASSMSSASAASASASASNASTASKASASAASASASASSAAAKSNAASAPFQTAGAGFGLGMAVAGMVALL